MEVIESFSGDYRFLSNFWYVPGTVYGYATNEHFYQAMKCTNPEFRASIKECETAGQAKRKGAEWFMKRQGFALRDDWNTLRNEVMITGLRRKFDPNINPKLARQLIATGDAYLIEGNRWHDNYWGVCDGWCTRRDRSARYHSKRHTVKGLNRLGTMLMVVREEIR